MSETGRFHSLAESIIDASLAADPVAATYLGDHRFDDRLPDLSPESVADRLRAIDDAVTALDAVDDVELDLEDQVDLEILRAAMLRQLFELDEVRRLEWDPMVWNPGTALHLLLSREFAPIEERAQSLRGRLVQLPDLLSDAASTLGEMSAIHLETALAQLAGTRHLVDGDVRDVVGDDDAVSAALEALDRFSRWLDEHRPDAQRDPRLGPHLYAGALWHALDDPVSAERLLTDARAQLDEISEDLLEAARDYLGDSGDDAVRRALDEVARSNPVTDSTVLELMARAMDRTHRFVAEHELVSIPDLDTRLIEMPEIHRGVAVAYCDAPGPLETAAVATYVAVAPTPQGWDDERVASFYREYNGIQLHDLAVHEGVPGHVLQLAHARSLASPTRVRRFGRSGVFIEGWAVYSEELLARHGYAPAGDQRSRSAFRLQQLKMQARSAINTILDIGVHAGGMSEAEAMELMTGRGFQEEGEAAGKWRRALLTSAQLPTYFAGYRAVLSLVDDLRVLHPDWTDRQVHDLVLSHGSPGPRHLRTLLGL
jgi:uncharacterized protein (DUF885 family)